MPRSKPPRQPARSPPNGAARVRRGRVLAALAEFLRNLALLFIGAPFIEPILTGAGALNATRAAFGIAAGLGLLAASLMFEWQRED